MDPESLGVWALGVFMGTAHVVEKLGDDNVRQLVSKTIKAILLLPIWSRASCNDY